LRQLAKHAAQEQLPDFVTIGAKKCATTSLHYYLGLHPQIAMAREKELNFFVLERNWYRGIDWYKSQFTGRGSIRGETSPDYTYRPVFEDVAARMHAVVPGAKLIYILRDPIERILSNYVHDWARGAEQRTISEALADLTASRYVWRSQYFMQLRQYLRYFSQPNILILTQEDLLHNRKQVMRQVFGFLGVTDTFYSLRFSHIKHPSRLKRRLTARGRRLAETPMMRAVDGWPSGVRRRVKAVVYFPVSRPVPRPDLGGPLRRALIEHLRDDVDRLRAWTGRDFAEWCV
jgi:hypothetical protein